LKVRFIQGTPYSTRTYDNFTRLKLSRFSPLLPKRSQPTVFQLRLAGYQDNGGHNAGDFGNPDTLEAWISYRDLHHSREKYGTRREFIEDKIKRWYSK
jgi:hypothetical protein